MTSEFDFDGLELIEVPVHYRGGRYVLREATADAARQYQNALSRCSTFKGGEFQGIQGPIADTESLLVSLCLFVEDGAAVSLADVRSWPARIVKPLHKKAMEISELSEDSDTVESVTKEVEILQKKLEQLKGETEVPLPQEPGDTTETSD